MYHQYSIKSLSTRFVFSRRVIFQQNIHIMWFWSSCHYYLLAKIIETIVTKKYKTKKAISVCRMSEKKSISFELTHYLLKHINPFISSQIASNNLSNLSSIGHFLPFLTVRIIARWISAIWVWKCAWMAQLYHSVNFMLTFIVTFRLARSSPEWQIFILHCALKPYVHVYTYNYKYIECIYFLKKKNIFKLI